MKFLLDTCTFLWLIGFPERLPDAIRASLEDGETNCAVSPATLWECLIKHGKGRLHFQIGERNSVLDFLLWQCEQHELDVLPIDADTLCPLERLPPLHSDPFDRLLISHAIEDGRVIVTPDPLIRKYPVKTMWG